MRLFVPLALVLAALACAPKSLPAASPVHDWLRYRADSWMSAQDPDGEWSVSGGHGGGGSGGLGGSNAHYSSNSRIRGRVPGEERSALLAGFRAEMERQIVASGGRIGGSSLSGTEDDPEGWSFDYEAPNGAVGGVSVEAVAAKDGWLVVILTSYEVR